MIANRASVAVAAAQMSKLDLSSVDSFRLLNLKILARWCGSTGFGGAEYCRGGRWERFQLEAVGISLQNGIVPAGYIHWLRVALVRKRLVVDHFMIGDV